MEDVFVGGYKRVNILQRGQNSQVWEVVEPGANRRFAMKLLLDERAGDTDLQKALKYEADIGKKLVHPRIIRTFSYSKDRGIPYILMELFPAQNLKMRILSGQSEEFIKPRLRNLVEQICQALSYMHSLKWVHRDVKPDNILVNGSGEVKLIDFALAVKETSGLAKLFARKSRTTAGTRSYMSPEQIVGRCIDQRADLYSFGIMLYELVSGRLPFVASSGSELLRKHLQAVPPPLESSLQLTDEFKELLYSTLEKKPDKRPKSMEDFLGRFRNTKIYAHEEIPQQLGM